MALLSWNSRIEPNPTKAAVVTSSSVALTAISSAFLFYTTSIFTMPDAANALNSRGPDSQDMKQAVEALKKIKAQEEEIKAAPKRPPDITKHSNDAALKVAAKLKNMNAKMYGAYWCSHCYNQKQTLGIEAYESFEYIECDKEGENSQNALCKSKKVPGYPTWEIAGELYPGEKDIDELEKLLTSIEKNKDLFKD
jgi:glutaredoxin